MRGVGLGLLVLVLAVVVPVAVVASVAVPRIEDPSVVIPALEESGAKSAVRRWASELVVSRVGEATGAPVRRTPRLEALMEDVLDDTWLASSASTVLRGLADPDPSVLDLVPVKERLVASWPELTDALYGSVPPCASEQAPVADGEIRCRPPELSLNQAMALGILDLPGPEIVLDGVPDQTGVRSFWTDAAGRAMRTADQNRSNLVWASVIALAALVLLAPSSRRVMWLGRGLLAPSLVLVAAGVLVLGVSALLQEGLGAAAADVMAAIYAPVLLGGAVLLLVSMGLAFATATR